MRVCLWNIIGGFASYSLVSSSSTSGTISSSGSIAHAPLTANAAGSSLSSSPLESDATCNLNEPWLCSKYAYYECHTCTLNNVCIFNEFAFIESGEFNHKMTHHCNNLPFDCNYFHEIKQCRSRYCATQSLCNLDVDGYEICLIKALLCYDEYCEPDLSSLPFDYRLYDLCCHINDIEGDTSRFHNWLVMILGVIAMVILLSLYEIYSAFTKHSFKKMSFNLYKKVKYLIKYVIRNYISVKILQQNIEYCYNELCKKVKKLKRNIKYHYKNNKMMWCFFNLFDEYLTKMTDVNIGSISIPLIWSSNKEQKQDVAQSNNTAVAEEGNKTNTNHNNTDHNNKQSKKSKTSNKKKRKLKEGHHKKRKKGKTKYKSTKKNHHNTTAKEHKEIDNKPHDNESNECVMDAIAIESNENETNDDVTDESVDDDDDDNDEKEISDNELEADIINTESHDNDDDDELEPEIEHETEEKAIEMISCPDCGSMNAAYLSNCDQCKSSMTKLSTKKKKKHKKSKQKKKGNNHHHNNKQHIDYWQCVKCTYHNLNKSKKCLMCQTTKEESKFSTKCTKKSKKKKCEKIHSVHKERHKTNHKSDKTSNHHHHHHTHNQQHTHYNHQIHLHQPKKKHKAHHHKHIAKKAAPHVQKGTNTLNPNAKEFIFETKPNLPTNTKIINNHHIPTCTNYTYSHSHSNSPSRRLSKIPRLQKSVNPEPDFAPRHNAHHTRHNNHVYCDEYEYEANPNHATAIYHDMEASSLISPTCNTTHHIPPRFQAPATTFHTLPALQSLHSISTQSSDESISPMNPINIALITPIGGTLLAPPAATVTVVEIPLADIALAEVAEIPAMDNADLQRQLSDMEANVHKQLQVLDTLFPTIKPDLSEEIKAMQENMKV